MSASIRVLLLGVPLVISALWGACHVPGQNSAGCKHRDITLDALPSLPQWAGAKLPDFASYEDSADRKNAFFSFLYPRIVLANSRILIERQYLETLSRQDTLTESETRWINEQAERLRVDEASGSDEMFRQLRGHLDVISPSLILSQAANESAWGTSRFALEGNNLFGQWCFSEGCGIVPENRGADKTHEVASFSSPYRSVTGYIQNLNSHPSYQLLRDVRRKARERSQFASGSDLAAGLIDYSERGEEYIEEIRSMISFNKLSQYDRDFRDVVLQTDATELSQLASSSKAESLLPAAGDSIENEG